ncbi:beta-ketoacyl synthase N-terminal-like domain-containing protein [Zobellella sp. DQSA1]|uniref:beta-ketoacyl synthase N-terminal-like domain-containing protein n=1 Tax=Zobellella sp. DQSA1 TaxID=3342386 RepID=UPI0035C1938C
MYYSVQTSSYKFPTAESPQNLSDSLSRLLPVRSFDNYDANRSLGKSRHLSSATKLLCSTATRLEGLNTEHSEDSGAVSTGIYVAADTINLEDDFEFDMCAKNIGPDYVSPLKAPNTLANVVGSHLARLYNIQGPNCTIASGQHSWFQALDMAQLALQAQTIRRALVGTVEVSSRYHKAFGRNREMALLMGVVPHTSSPVRFREPLLGRQPRWDTEHLAKVLTSHLAKQGVTRVDAIIQTGDPLNPDRQRDVEKTFVDSGLSRCLVKGESLFGNGESGSAGLAMLLTDELLSCKGSFAPLTQDIYGAPTSETASVLILSLDEALGYSALLLERTP